MSKDAQAQAKAAEEAAKKLDEYIEKLARRSHLRGHRTLTVCISMQDPLLRSLQRR